FSNHLAWNYQVEGGMINDKSKYLGPPRYAPGSLSIVRARIRGLPRALQHFHIRCRSETKDVTHYGSQTAGRVAMHVPSGSGSKGRSLLAAAGGQRLRPN